MTASERASAACHNCRRQRRKCDRSMPHCRKCFERGQECLGYQRLFRWDQGAASRGKLTGMTFEDMLRGRVRRKDQRAPVFRLLPDPLFQDLDPTSRQYLSYFASHVCQDLVLYDVPYGNPFRDLVPLTGHYPSLLHIMIATSALRMSNASKHPCPSSGFYTADANRRKSHVAGNQTYALALAAKQTALTLLNSALDSMNMDDVDAILAIVLLFIEFELMDTGQNEWRHHVRGARPLIDMIYRPGERSNNSMSTLRRCLISNCLVYDVLGTAFASPGTLMPSNTIANGALSLLQDAEGNHCASFPFALLQLIQDAARILRGSTDCTSFEPDRSVSLLEQAKQFDACAWATDIQMRSPISDLEPRIHIAAAHRAATCVYLSRVTLALRASPQVYRDIPIFVAEVEAHLAEITPGDVLFAATAWPAFIAGAEAKDAVKQKWATMHFQKLWEVQPWGLIQGALEVLHMIWTKDDRPDEIVDDDFAKQDGAWLKHLTESKVDWLIL